MLNLDFSRFRAILLCLVLCCLGACSRGPTETDDGDGDGNIGPPSDVADLTVTGVSPTTVDLRWSAPTGGSPTILASGYDVRYAASPVTEVSWASAIQADGEPAPLPPGSPQVMQLGGWPLSRPIGSR